MIKSSAEKNSKSIKKIPYSSHTSINPSKTSKVKISNFIDSKFDDIENTKLRNPFISENMIPTRNCATPKGCGVAMRRLKGL